MLSKHEYRKREIIEAFYQVITERGIDAAPIKEIAKKLDVTPSLIFHYYDSKEGLLRDLVDYILIRTSEVYAEVIDNSNVKISWEDKLRYYIEKHLSLDVAQTIEDQVFYSVLCKVFINDDIRSEFVTMYDEQSEITKQLIEKYMQEKKIELDSKVLADFLIVLSEGLNLYHSVYGDSESFSALVEESKSIFFEKLQIETGCLDEKGVTL